MKEIIIENYKIFENGKIIKLSNNKELKHFKDKEGYIIISKKIYNTKRLHRILAIAFIPNPENKPIINHKNGIKHDFNLDNLEWCTYSENSKHAYKLGLAKNKKGQENTLSKKIYVFDKNLKIIDEVFSLNECSKKYNLTVSTISYQTKLKLIHLDKIKTKYIFSYNKNICFKKLSDIEENKRIIYVYNNKKEIIDKLTSVTFASKKYNVAKSTIKFQLKKNVLSFSKNEFYFSINNNLI